MKAHTRTFPQSHSKPKNACNIHIYKFACKNQLPTTNTVKHCLNFPESKMFHAPSPHIVFTLDDTEQWTWTMYTGQWIYGH